MRGSVSTLHLWTNYFKPSTRPRMTAWGSDCRFRVPLSNNIMAVYGQREMMVQEQHFHFLFLARPIPKCNRLFTESAASLCYGLIPRKDSWRIPTCGSSG